MRMQVYEYPLKDHLGEEYVGSYTIKKGVKPLGFQGEKLVQEFDLVKSNVNWEKEKLW